jgi:putative transposase
VIRVRPIERTDDEEGTTDGRADHFGILQEHEAGAKCADLCRKHGMSEGTFYAWKAKYSGMTVSEAKRLKALEDENAKLKKLLAEQMLDMAAMKELLSKKW